LAPASAASCPIRIHKADFLICERGPALDANLEHQAAVWLQTVPVVELHIESGDCAIRRQLAEAGAEVCALDPLGPEMDWTSVGTGRYRLLLAELGSSYMAGTPYGWLDRPL
jgi:hypothetical protein